MNCAKCRILNNRQTKMRVYSRKKKTYFKAKKDWFQYYVCPRCGNTTWGGFISKDELGKYKEFK